MSDPLAVATAKVTELVTRKVKPPSSLEASFMVVEAMDEATAKKVFAKLVQNRYLCQMDADMAQLLAQRLKVEIAWSHLRFNGGEWIEGRGS